MAEWRSYTGISLEWLGKMMINLNQNLSQETQWPARIQTRKLPYTILACSHHTNSWSTQLEDHEFTIDGSMHLTSLNGLRKLIWEAHLQKVVPTMVHAQQQCCITCKTCTLRAQQNKIKRCQDFNNMMFTPTFKISWCLLSPHDFGTTIKCPLYSEKDRGFNSHLLLCMFLASDLRWGLVFSASRHVSINIVFWRQC